MGSCQRPWLDLSSRARAQRHQSSGGDEEIDMAVSYSKNSTSKNPQVEKFGGFPDYGESSPLKT